MIMLNRIDDELYVSLEEHDRLDSRFCSTSIPCVTTDSSFNNGSIYQEACLLVLGIAVQLPLACCYTFGHRVHQAGHAKVQQI